MTQKNCIGLCSNLCPQIYEYYGQTCFHQSVYCKKSEISDPNNHGYITYNVTFEHLYADGLKGNR